MKGTYGLAVYDWSLTKKCRIQLAHLFVVEFLSELFSQWLKLIESKNSFLDLPTTTNCTFCNFFIKLACDHDFTILEAF